MPLYDINAALKPTEGPIEQFTKLQQLRALTNQQQLQQQQLANEKLQNQSGQIALQQQQLGLQSQKAIMQAYTEANGDLDKTVQLAPKYGATPSDLIKLRQASIEQQKASMELLNAKGARAIQEADWMKGAHDAVDQAPADQKPQVYQQQLFGLQKLGVDVSQMPAQYPGDDNFKLIGAMVQGHKAQLEDMAKQAGIGKDIAQTGEAQARTGEAKASTAKTQLETMQLQQAGGNPAMQEARYRTILSKLAAKQQVSPDDIAFARGYEASNAKATTSSDSLGVTSTNMSRPAGLSAVGAGGGAASAGGAGAAQNNKQSIVDEVGQYKMDPALLGRTLFKHPELLGLIRQSYPDWDQTNYTAKNKMATYMTSGAGGKQLTAFNTAIQHLDLLDKLSTDLNNTDLQIANRAKQAWATQTGNPAPANFEAAKNAMSGEVAAALKASGATDQEISHVGSTFDRAQSPAQLKGAIATYRTLLNSKAQQLQNQYQSGIQGKPNFGNQGQHTPGGGANLPEGTTGTGSDGRKYVVKGGVWVPR